MKQEKEAFLMLEDGRAFRGLAFGADGERCGEIVFNTSMTGYQEILTDPSYAGQIVCMTPPLIGNYGVNYNDVESRRIWVEGFVVRELSRVASNWSARETLDQYLKRENINGIGNIDTRALVRHIRDKGAMRACISNIDSNLESLLEKARSAPKMLNRELASLVSTKAPYTFPADGDEKFHVVCFDFGVKTNSLRSLAARGCRITVVPSNSSAADVLKTAPDGVFLSNGPGDPASMKSVCAEIVKLSQSKLPIFGICLGHQLLASAFGAETFKLHFGHRGGNHPIKDLRTGKIAIAAHNHGFSVDEKTLPDEIEISHLNINDNTIAGIRHKSLPAFSVQYHPEAAPGPHDAIQHFDEFISLMETNNPRLSKTSHG